MAQKKITFLADVDLHQRFAGAARMQGRTASSYFVETMQRVVDEWDKLQLDQARAQLRKEDRARRRRS